MAAGKTLRSADSFLIYEARMKKKKVGMRVGRGWFCDLLCRRLSVRECKSEWCSLRWDANGIVFSLFQVSISLIVVAGYSNAVFVSIYKYSK